MKRWTAMSCEQLLAELHDSPLAYEVEFNSNTYNVEVELLENTAEYLHVNIAVDDGHLPACMFPVSESFICRRAPARG